MRHVLIPARGGSKRLVGKNLLDVGGDPLVVRAIKLAQQLRPGDTQVHVSTDDSQIATLAEMFGARVVHRPYGLADDFSTVDDVVEHFLRDWSVNDPLIVLQPTVVADSKVLIQALRDLWHRGEEITTPTALAIRPHGLMWGGEVAPPRINSQDFLDDFPLQEIGIRYYPQGAKSGAIEAVRFVPDQFIDIDTPEDLVAARALADRSKLIVFRVRFGSTVGSGHLYRALAIARELQHHRILFDFLDGAVPPDFYFGIKQPEIEYEEPAVIINDALDTHEDVMLRLKSHAPVVTFEDLGSGARHADAVVNALYPSSGLSNEYAGSEYAILRPEFQDSGFSRKGIVVSFGGTDSLDLTTRVAELLGPRAEYVKPPYGTPSGSFPMIDNPSMGALFNGKSLVITSAGRTVLEAAACGTPAIVLAQNARETTHAHLGLEHGNLYLGLANFVTDEKLLHSINAFCGDYALQDEMAYQAKRSIDRRGLQRVVRIIKEVMA